MTSPWRDLLHYAEFLRENGNLYLDLPPGADVASLLRKPATASPAAAVAVRSVSPERARPQPSQPPPRATIVQANLAETAKIALPPSAPIAGKLLSEEERIRKIEEAQKIVSACTACGLAKTRNRTVYGSGSPMAKIVFVGEAPGEEEDRQGLPFVGRAGHLLTQMIEAMGFKREEVYICNTLKCRPPGNRDPLPEEKESCRPFLIQQLEWLRPQILVALGAHAGTYLTGLEVPVGKLRKQWHLHRGILTLVTYHPAFLLRSPGFKKEAWGDLQMLYSKYIELNPDDARNIWKKGA